MVTKISILVHQKQDLKTIVKTDFFDNINHRVFFQLGKERLLLFIAFFFQNLNNTKWNYKIYDKDLLAIVKYFK